ncbi:hypothetical protein BJV78DRAFT_1097164, partial [Lactifluus subvellereus]
SNQQPTENTPLFSSRSNIDDGSLETASQSTLTTVFLTTLFIIILLLSLAYSYAARASHLSNEDILNSSLVFRGPDALDALNISEHGGVWLRLDGRVGFDAGTVTGVNPDDDDNNFWVDAWKAIRCWGIRNLDVVSIVLSSINITPQYDPAVHLVPIETPPFQIPLTANPPDDTSWLTPISLPVHVHPSHNMSAWLTFARKSWRSGYVVAQAPLARANLKIQGGPLRGATWRSALRTDLSNVTVGLHMKIPVLPNLPASGNGLPISSISDLVHVTQFCMSSGAHNLTIDATVTIVTVTPPLWPSRSPRLLYPSSSGSRPHQTPITLLSACLRHFGIFH